MNLLRLRIHGPGGVGFPAYAGARPYLGGRRLGVSVRGPAKPRRRGHGARTAIAVSARRAEGAPARARLRVAWSSGGASRGVELGAARLRCGADRLWQDQPRGGVVALGP